MIISCLIKYCIALTVETVSLHNLQINQIIFSVWYIFGFYILKIFSPFVQEEQRLRLRWSSLEQDLDEKEQQLQDALNRQQELTDRIHILKSKEMHIKEENERLLRAKVTTVHINGMLHQKYIQGRRTYTVLVIS
jgi:uncharacterized membrane-anchored protein YhcB (DUF1043 family)